MAIEIRVPRCAIEQEVYDQPLGRFIQNTIPRVKDAAACVASAAVLDPAPGGMPIIDTRPSGERAYTALGRPVTRLVGLDLLVGPRHGPGFKLRSFLRRKLALRKVIAKPAIGIIPKI